MDTKRSLTNRLGDSKPMKAVRKVVHIVRESTIPEALLQAGIAPEEVRKITGRIPQSSEK